MISTRSCVRGTGWPLERVLFAMAGTVTLLSALLAAVASPWFLLLTAFLGRAFGLRSTVYAGKETAPR